MTTSSNVDPNSLRAELGKSHILALDALRGISAILVLGGHLGFLPGDCGYLGVSIFFVISGFLITWLLLRENDAAGTVELTAFYARRTLRIMPAFYVFWVVCILVNRHIGVAIPWKEAWYTFFYLGDYYNAFRYLWFTGPSIMVVAWSLGVEEKFYLIWPSVFKLRRLQPRSLCRIAIGTIVCALVYRSVIWYLHPPLDYLRYAFEARLDNIAFGCLLAIAVFEGYATKAIRAVTAHASYPVITMAVLAGAMFIETTLGGSCFNTVGMTVNSALITVLLIQLVILARTSYSWVEMRPLRWLGSISYSLYLYHVTVIDTVNHYLPNQRWRVRAGCSIIASILAAAASYNLVEKPFLRMKERFSPKKVASLPTRGAIG